MACCEKWKKIKRIPHFQTEQKENNNNKVEAFRKWIWITFVDVEKKNSFEQVMKNEVSAKDVHKW